MVMMIRAHRRFSSCAQTHNAPFTAVACCRGSAASHPQSTRRGQALPPALRPTRPTLTSIAPPNRLPSQRPLLLQPRSMPPLSGFPVPAGGHRRPRQQQERHSPIASQRFAPQKPSTNKLRPTMPAQRQKTATLRRSGSFGFGQQGTPSNGSVPTAVLIFSGMPLARCLAPQSALLPVPKALRPPQHLSKRMAGSRGAPPLSRYSVRPLCVQGPPCPKPASRSAAKAASVRQGSKYKSPCKRCSR